MIRRKGHIGGAKRSRGSFGAEPDGGPEGESGDGERSSPDKPYGSSLRRGSGFKSKPKPTESGKVGMGRGRLAAKPSGKKQSDKKQSGKTRRAIAKLRRAVEQAEASGGAVTLSDWETEFASGVTERLETFGSAFCDPAKGEADEPLSVLQAQKLAQISAKVRKGKRQAEARDDGDGAPVPDGRGPGWARNGGGQGARVGTWSSGRGGSLRSNHKRLRGGDGE